MHPSHTVTCNIRNLQLFVPFSILSSEETPGNQTLSLRKISRRVMDHMVRQYVYLQTKGDELQEELYRDLDYHLLMFGMND